MNISFFFKKWQLFLFYCAIGFLVSLSSLHLFVGYADNGDFSRSVSFLFEKPYGFSEFWPLPETIEWKRRFFSEWHDKWVFLPNWPTKGLVTLSSYKPYLLLQAKLSALLISDQSYYSIILGSIISRFILLSEFFVLFYYVRKSTPAMIFWLFVALASAVFLDVSFTAFLNSFYEEQVAIIFLPAVALLLYKYNQKYSLAVGFSALTFAVIIGSAKEAYFYFPIIIAPFLFPIFRGKYVLAKFILIIAICQSITFLPIYFGRFHKINSYHALYFGALKVAQKNEAKNIIMIGSKPVLHECIGVNAYQSGGEACVEKTKSSYGDVIKLIYEHPIIGYRMGASLFYEGNNIELKYLGKNISGAPDFSSLPIFKLTSMIFLYSFNLVVLLITFFTLSAFILMKGKDQGTNNSMLKVGLFLSIFGFSQYPIALADGFQEITKHLIVGNYSLALSFVFFMPGFFLLLKKL